MLVEMAIGAAIVIISIIFFIAGVMGIQWGYRIFKDAGFAFSKETDRGVGVLVILSGVAVILLDVALIAVVFGL